MWQWWFEEATEHLNKESAGATAGLRTSDRTHGDKQSFPLSHSGGVESSIPEGGENGNGAGGRVLKGITDTLANPEGNPLRQDTRKGSA